MKGINHRAIGRGYGGGPSFLHVISRPKHRPEGGHSSLLPSPSMADFRGLLLMCEYIDGNTVAVHECYPGLDVEPVPNIQSTSFSIKQEREI